jgi:hypothetical protein
MLFDYAVSMQDDLALKETRELFSSVNWKESGGRDVVLFLRYSESPGRNWDNHQK